jgi:hypothetical protein
MNQQFLVLFFPRISAMWTSIQRFFGFTEETSHFSVTHGSKPDDRFRILRAIETHEDGLKHQDFPVMFLILAILT